MKEVESEGRDPLEGLKRSLENLEKFDWPEEVKIDFARATVIIKAADLGEKGIDQALRLAYEKFPGLLPFLENVDGAKDSVSKFVRGHPGLLASLERKVKPFESGENLVPPESPDQKS